MRAIPFLTIATALLAVAVYAWPEAREFCVLDRRAFFHGEWWRAFTAHVVHFSPSHLWWDATVFVSAGAFVEWRSRRIFASLFIAASMAVTGAVLVFTPEFQFYGGLSGVATAMLFFAALQCVAGKGTIRVCAIFVISAILAKLVFEGLNPQPWLARFESASIRSAPVSHAAGIVAAMTIWCGTHLRQWRGGGTNYFSRRQLVPR